MRLLQDLETLWIEQLLKQQSERKCHLTKGNVQGGVAHQAILVNIGVAHQGIQCVIVLHTKGYVFVCNGVHQCNVTLVNTTAHVGLLALHTKLYLYTLELHTKGASTAPAWIPADSSTDPLSSFNVLFRL